MERIVENTLKIFIEKMLKTKIECQHKYHTVQAITELLQIMKKQEDEYFKELKVSELSWHPVSEKPTPHEKLLVRLDTNTILMGIMDDSEEFALFFADGRNYASKDNPVIEWIYI